MAQLRLTPPSVYFMIFMISSPLDTMLVLYIYSLSGDIVAVQFYYELQLGEELA